MVHGHVIEHIFDTHHHVFIVLVSGQKISLFNTVTKICTCTQLLHAYFDMMKQRKIASDSARKLMINRLFAYFLSLSKKRMWWVIYT